MGRGVAKKSRGAVVGVLQNTTLFLAKVWLKGRVLPSLGAL
jgi:hypothetical protein